MLRWRLLLGTVFVAALVGLCWLDHVSRWPGITLLPLAVVVVALGSGELLWLLRSRNLLPTPWVVYLGNALIVASAAVGFYWPAGYRDPLGLLGWPLMTFAIAVLLALAVEVKSYRRPGDVMERLGLTVFALAYLGLLAAFFVLMRLLAGGTLGVPALASLLIVVKLCDTGAYAVGRLFGKRKMSPHLSPGKTVEGGIGGLAVACLGSLAVFWWLIPAMVPTFHPTAWGWLWFGLLVGPASMLGDLAESLIKRDMGRKDSSAWMPGFGGVLDLLDSLLLAAPVAYGCWVFGVVQMPIDSLALQLMLIVFMATSIRAVFGFADALVAMPLVSLLVGKETATPLVALVSIATASAMLVRGWRHVEFRSAVGLIVPALLGIPVGLMYLRQVDEDVFRLLLGGLVTAFALFNLLRPPLGHLKSDRWACLFGFFGGMAGGAYNVPGPFVVVFGTLRGWPPERFRATLQGYFLPTGMVILAGHAASGLWTATVWRHYLYCLPSIAAALLFGGWLRRRFDAQRFTKLVHLLLLALGITLVVNAIS